MPPLEMKSWISGQGDILVLDNVCPSPPEMKKLDSGQGDILVLGDVPGQNESSVELAGFTIFSRFYFYTGWIFLRFYQNVVISDCFCS